MGLKHFYNRLRPTIFLAGAEEPAPPWTPASVSNLVLWLTPDGPRDSGNNLPDDAENVATWLDESGEGNTCTATGGTPQFETSGIGGLGSVFFSENQNEWFTQSGVTPKNNMTIIVVHNRLNSGDTGGKVFVGAQSGDPDWDRCRIGVHARNPNVGYGAASTNKISMSTTDNTDYWSYVRWRDTDDAVKQKISSGETHAWTHGGENIDNNNWPFAIGADNQAGTPAAGSSWHGWIAEVLIYEQYVSDADIALLEAYLDAKYGT